MRNGHESQTKGQVSNVDHQTHGAKHENALITRLEQWIPSSVFSALLCPSCGNKQHYTGDSADSASVVSQVPSRILVPWSSSITTEFSIQKRQRLEEFIFLNINLSTSKSKLFNSWIAIFKFFSYCLCGRMYFNFWFCGKPCSWLKNVHPIILCYSILKDPSVSVRFQFSIDEKKICLSCNDTIKFERHLTCARARPTSCFFIIIRNHL